MVCTRAEPPPLDLKKKPTKLGFRSHGASAISQIAGCSCRNNMEEAGGGFRSGDEADKDRGSYERRLNEPSQAAPGLSAPLTLLNPHSAVSTSTPPSGPLLATGNIIIVSVDPKSTLRPLFTDDGDGSLEKSASEMQTKAKRYLAFVRNVEYTTTTVTTTTMMAVPGTEEGVEDQDVTVRRPSVASTIKGVEKKVTTTTTRVHLNLLHTAIPTRSRYDTVDETMNVPLALYHPRSTTRSRFDEPNAILSDREPLRVRNGHGIFKKYNHLYAHTIMDAYAVVSEVTPTPSTTNRIGKELDKNHRATRRDRVPTISRRDLKRYDMYQKVDRIKESNQFVTKSSPTTPTTPTTHASFSSPRYPSTTRRLGKTSMQSIGLLSSRDGLPEEGESDFGEDEEEGGIPPEGTRHSSHEDEEDEDEDEDAGSQFRLSTVISSLSIDHEDPNYRLSPLCRSASSSSSPPLSRSSSLRRRPGAAAPSAWKQSKHSPGRRSNRSPHPHQQPSSPSTNDENTLLTPPRDATSPKPPPRSSPLPTKSSISLQIPSTPTSIPRPQFSVVPPSRTPSVTDTSSSVTRERTSSEWPTSFNRSDSHGTQATSVHSSQNPSDGRGDYSSSLMSSESSFGDSSSSEDEMDGKKDNEDESGENEEKVWKEKYDLGGGMGPHKPLNRQCFINVKAWYLPTTAASGRRSTIESSGDEGDVVPEDPRMFFEELKMLRALERSSDMRYLSRLRQQNAERVLAWRDTAAVEAKPISPPSNSDSEQMHDPSLSSSTPSSRRSSALMSFLPLANRRRRSSNFNTNSSTHGHGLFSSLNPFATAPSTSSASNTKSLGKRRSGLHPAASGSEATSSAVEDSVSHGRASQYPSSVSIASRTRTRSITSLHSHNRRQKSTTDGTDASTHSKSGGRGLHIHLPLFFSRAGHQDGTSEDDGMTSADGNGDSSSRRASMPAKKTRRSSLFSRQRPSLPSPSPSTLPIGLDPLVNRSAISGRLVHRDDGVSLEGGGIGQQYQESREGQEVQSQGHGEHRSINLSTHSLGLGSKSNSSSQHIPIPIPDGDASLREMEEVGRLGEGQFVPTAPLPIPIPTSNLSPTLILTPVSDPAPASAPAIASLHITLPPRIEQERQRSAMRTRMPRNKTRRETSLLRKAWNRLTCQPTLPASPIDGHRNPFDRSSSSSSSVPTTTPHHIPLKPSISNPSTGSPTAFTTTTTSTTTAATSPLSSQYPPSSSPSSPPLPPPLHSPTFSIQQQQHNRLHRRPHSSPPPRHRQPQPQPQLSV